MFLLRYYFFVKLFLLVFFANESKCECYDNGKCDAIIDGNYTTIQGRFPHAVAIVHITNISDLYCGGSAIKKRVVLTAAHCVYVRNKYTKRQMRVAAGHNEYKLSQKIRNVTDSICHPCFKWKTMHNDIAVLLLNEELPVNSVIGLATISSSWPANVQKVNVSGWGAMQPGGAISEKIRYVEMNVYSREKCCKIMQNVSAIKKHGQFCVGDRHLTVAKNVPLRGDSGGNLIVSNGVHKHLSIGVVCITEYCSFLEKRPGVVMATNVTFFYDWIMEKIEKDFKIVS